MKMYPRVFMVAIVATFLLHDLSLAQDESNEIFKNNCATCHTVGQGQLIGPDLAHIQERRSDDWIIKFIKSSQTVIKSGDKYADSLFKAFNQMPMPDHPNLTENQIKQLLAYIGANSGPAEAVKASVGLLSGDSQRGKELFVGNIRFVNKGASCNSCHNVEMKGFVSGGALAKDLTHAVTRLSTAGVASIISGLPFPQMKETYVSRPVTAQEIADLTAFLAKIDKEAPVRAGSSVGRYLLAGGVIGIIFLLGLYSFFWIKRKKRPVYFSVFKRQLRSV